VISDPAVWHSVPVTGVYAERGIGVLDLARNTCNSATPIACLDDEMVELPGYPRHGHSGE
jgi:hypothetical protein